MPSLKMLVPIEGEKGLYRGTRLAGLGTTLEESGKRRRVFSKPRRMDKEYANGVSRGR